MSDHDFKLARERAQLTMVEVPAERVDEMREEIIRLRAQIEQERALQSRLNDEVKRRGDMLRWLGKNAQRPLWPRDQPWAIVMHECWDKHITEIEALTDD